MKKLILIALTLVSITSYAQTKCYKDSLAWTLQGGLQVYLPFCGNNYNNNTIKSNVKFANDSVYQMLPNYSRPTLTTDRFNNSNSAMLFNGTQFLAYNSTQNITQYGAYSSFSFSVWIKPNGSSVGTRQVILVNSTDKPDVGQYWYFGRGEGLLFLEGNQVKTNPAVGLGWNYSMTQQIESATIKSLGTISTNWTNYAVTYDYITKKIKYYKNGIKIDSAVGIQNNNYDLFRVPTSVWGNQLYTKHLYVGGYPDFYANCGSFTSNGGYKDVINKYEGKIDDLFLYNRVLNDNEINSIYSTSGNYNLAETDTMYIHDTTIIVNCKYYDTITTHINVYDTITTHINVYDTTHINVYDTLFIDYSKMNYNTTNSVFEKVVETIKVYPTPTLGSITLNVDKGDTYVYDYKLSNSQGAIVLKGRLSDKITSIDIKSLSSGIYYLQIDDLFFTTQLPPQIITKKIVITNN